VTATVCGSMEAVLESVNQLQELRSEHFFFKLGKEVQSKIAEYGLQAIASTSCQRSNAKPLQSCYAAASFKQRCNESSFPRIRVRMSRVQVRVQAFVSPSPNPEEQNFLTSQPRLSLQLARTKKVTKRFNIFLTRNITVSSKQ